MDCMMPVMDGFEASQRIKNLPHPSDLSKKYPAMIIALTAMFNSKNVRKSKECGMEKFILKPPNIDEIRQIIFEAFIQE